MFKYPLPIRLEIILQANASIDVKGPVMNSFICDGLINGALRMLDAIPETFQGEEDGQMIITPPLVLIITKQKDHSLEVLWPQEVHEHWILDGMLEGARKVIHDHIAALNQKRIITDLAARNAVPGHFGGGRRM